MIRINRQTDYAVRVLLALARHGSDELLSTSQIQQEMLIPPALAQRIVAELARGGKLELSLGKEPNMGWGASEPPPSASDPGQ